MFYKSHKKSSSREFDYLYDPLYIVASARDVQKKNIVALTRTAPLNLYTNYSDMFSDSPHRSRHFFILQQNPLPRVPTFSGGSNVMSKGAEVSTTGRNRATFFDIPLGPMKAAVNQQFEVDCFDGADARDVSHGSKMHAVGCQTIYREQSAQTRPFSPMLQFQRDSEMPEVALIADLIDGDQSPGKYEADVIVRARKRRNWEKLLENAPSSAMEPDEQRLIHEAIEWENWLAREEEIENNQLERLDYVRQMLDERSKMNASNSAGRLNESIERVTSEYERDITTIHAQHDRRVRKLRRTYFASINSINSSKRSTEIELSAFTTTPGHFEKFSSQFVVQKQPSMGFNKKQLKQSVERMYTITQRLRISVDEIQRGFRKQYNYRLIYECLKAFRLKQTAYDELGKLVKALKSFKLTGMEVEKCKERLVNLVALLNKLGEAINRSEMCAIDADLDLLYHKFNAILHDGNFSNDCNPMDVVLCGQNDETALYLEDILTRCKSCCLPPKDSCRESLSRQQTSATLNSQEFIMDFMHEVVWPEIFRRLDQQKRRKTLMVDLEKLASQERRMVKEVGSDCVAAALLAHIVPFRENKK